MRGRIHLDGEPSTFRQMRALFPTEQTATVKWDKPLVRKFALLRDAQGRWIKTQFERLWRAA